MGESRLKAIDGMGIGERDQCSRSQHAYQVIAVYQHAGKDGTISIPRIVCAKCGSTIDPFADIGRESHLDPVPEPVYAS